MMISFITWVILTMFTFGVSHQNSCSFYDNNEEIVRFENECVIFGVCTCAQQVDVIWKFNNLTIYLRSRSIYNGTWIFSANNSVSIYSVKVSHAGRYTCLCSGESQKEYILKVNVEPNFYVSVDEANYTSGTYLYFNVSDLPYVTVTCHADGGRPEVNLRWLINNDEIDTSKLNTTIVQSSTKLNTWDSSNVLMNYSFVGHENVTCIRDHQYNVAETGIWIKILTFVEPYFYVNVSSMIYNSSGNFTVEVSHLQFISVTCHAIEGRPPVNLTWSINNDKIEASECNSTVSQSVEKPNTWDSSSVLNNYRFTGNENVTCIRGPQYNSGEHKIWINFISHDATPSSTPMRPITTEMTLVYDISILLVFAISSATLLIGGVVAVLKCTKKRSKQKTNQPVQDYEECRTVDHPRIDVSPISCSSQDYAPVSGQNEVGLMRDCVTLLSTLPGEGKMKYWTAVLSTDVSHKFMFVAKTLSDSAQLKDLYNFQKIANQLKALTSHKNIVDILGTDDTEVPCFVYHRFEEGGTLRNFMLTNYDRRHESQLHPAVTERILQPFEDWKLQLTRFALDVAEGMEFLRQNSISHPAICSRKVLLSRNGICKLYDFVPDEIAQNRLIDFLEQKCPPLAWLPPEAIFLRRYSWQADVWSFAVVLWEIFSFGQTPFEGLTTEEIEKEIRCDRCLSQPLCCPGGVYCIMLSSWNVSYEERPTFSVITQKLRAAVTSFKQDSSSENDVTEGPNYFVLEERVFENDYES